MAIQSNFPAIRPSLLLDFANSKRLDPRITFTRASTARYYDGSTVAKAEENLYLQSQTFGTTWATTSGAVSANVDVAPDGTSTADLFYPTSSGTYRTIGQTINFRTLSVFAKPSGFSWIALGFAASAGNYTWFDVTNGVVGTTSASVSSATITSVGNGWYRCVITFSADQSGLAARVMVADSNGSTTATTSGTNGILLWGAQAELRTAVTAYTATTTQAITNYVPVLQTAQNNVPRFDHNPTTGESLGLLIEEARTNLFLYSGDLSDAAFVKSSVTVSSNTIVAPDGTLTGDKVIVDSGTASASGVIRQQITKAASAITYTASFFAKAGEFNSVRVIFRDVSNSANFVQTYFNLATGTVASAANSGGTFSAPSSSISAVGNGWYRCVLTGTTGTETTVDLRVLEYNNGTNSITGDGYSGLYLWGYQLEAGAFATSYIATTAASATRQADAASMTGTNFSSWYDAAEGTLYGEAIGFGAGSGGATALMQVDDGTTNNRITIGMLNTSTTGALVTVGGSSQVGISVSFTASYNKNVFAYKVNDFAQSLNGGAVQTDTSGLIPVVSVMRIASNATSANNVCVRKLAYYPLRLTDAQLQAITG